MKLPSFSFPFRLLRPHAITAFICLLLTSTTVGNPLPSPSSFLHSILHSALKLRMEGLQLHDSERVEKEQERERNEWQLSSSTCSGTACRVEFCCVSCYVEGRKSWADPGGQDVQPDERTHLIPALTKPVGYSS
ncbi:unnamed protein product [Cyclocybe aegerita]|uniref:Uncharacterized protein n=1 Tax=Cyclocybe aegerita TaxID=1973307 RepID=A0A8S0WIE2_CYCAE|nr:unnamed protein product [Cyclocybe aegerita]